MFVLKTKEKMNYIKNTIGWAEWSWNPLVGCRKGCNYCYAKAMNERFKFIPDFSKPQFFPERLSEPSKLKKPSKIFVCSMGEIFDINFRIIIQIIEIMKICPQHTFMILTQKPDCYPLHKFPDNVWLGLTLANEYEVLNARHYSDFLRYTGLSNNKRFVSIEPIRDTFNNINLSAMDLVIVGAMTGPKAKPTYKSWIESVKHNNIFYKESAKRILEQ